MAKIKFVVEMFSHDSDGEFESKELEEEIAKQTAQIIAEKIKPEIRKQIIDTVVSTVQSEVLKTVATEAEKLLVNGIEERSQWGEVKRVVPIKAFIMEALTKKSDSYSSSPTIGEKVFEKLLEKEMKKVLAPLFKAKKEQLEKLVDTELMKLFFDVAKKNLNIQLG